MPTGTHTAKTLVEAACPKPRADEASWVTQPSVCGYAIENRCRWTKRVSLPSRAAIRSFFGGDMHQSSSSSNSTRSIDYFGNTNY